MADDSVKVTLRVDDNQATQAFIRMERGITDFTSSFTKGIGLSDRAFDVFKGNIAANVVSAGFNIMTDAAKQLFDVILVKGVDSAIEFEDQMQTLNVALKNSGQFSVGLSRDLEELAQQTQETTKYSDGMVISATTQLQTLARLSGDGLQRATKASIDLAAALRIDLTTASELVAKAHEGQTNALRRNGIVISESIPASEKYAEVLRIIETRFGGTAQAQANTYAARIEILKNQFDDTIKQFGFFITKNEGVNAILKVGTEILKEYTGGLTGGKVASDTMTQSLVYMATIIEPLALLADGFGRVFVTAFRAGEIAIDSTAIVINRFFIMIMNGVDAVYKGLAYAMPEAFGKASSEISKFTTGFAQGTDNLTKKTADNFSNMLGIFEETTSIEKFAARARKAAIDIQLAIAAQSVRPAVQDQQAAGEDPTEAARKEAQEERLKQAEISQILLSAQAERDAAGAQYRIAVGEGRTQDLIDLQTFEQQKIQITLDAELAKAKEQDGPRKIQLAKDKAHADAELALVKLSNKSKVELRKQELADQEVFLNTAATLSGSKNKELAAIGKAAAITQIAIKTPPAIASSFEFGTKLGGPVLGFALAGIAGTAMAAQAANIAGVKFEQGGIVPGLPQFGDNVIARVNPGEVFLNNTQQQRLLNIADGKNGSSSSDNLLQQLIDAIRSQPIITQLDGRTLGVALRDLKSGGFAF